MRKTELPTPALVVDLDLMEANIASMQSAVNQAGKALRPHAKAHSEWRLRVGKLRRARLAFVARL